MTAIARDVTARLPSFARAYTVLAVDDEPDNLLVLRASFRGEFHILTVSSAEEALALMQRQAVAVLLTDQRMPGMTGVELCERVRDLYPEVQRMLVTAYSDRDVAIAAINRGGVGRFIQKPWDADELRQALREAVARAHLEKMVSRLRLAMLDRERYAGAHAANARLLQDLAQTNTSLAACCQRLEQLAPRLAGDLDAVTWTSYQREVGELRRYVDFMGALQGRRVAVEGGSVRPQRELRALEDLIDTAVELVRHELAGVARLTVHCPPQAAVWADATDVSRVLIHLLRSAIGGLRAAGRVDGRISLTASSEGGSTVVRVADDGPLCSQPTQRAMLEAGHPDLRAPGLEAALELTIANGGTLDAVTAESGEEGGGLTAWQLSLPAAEPLAPASTVVASSGAEQVQR